MKNTKILNIQSYIQSVSPDFKNVIRLNQDHNRYKFIGLIESTAIKSKSKVISLFYEDLIPKIVNNISIGYKQDLVIEQNNKYLFVIGNSWYLRFPELKKFLNKEIVSIEKFKNANGKQGLLDNGEVLDYKHHFEIRELPRVINGLKD